MDKKEARNILISVLGYSKPSGREILFKCPVCDHHKLKLSINLSKNAFKCWICDYRGRNIRRIIRRFGSFIQLQKWDQITNREDLERFSDLFNDEVKEEINTIELPECFLSLANKKQPATSKFANQYLNSRGISKQDILRWKIGFCFEGEYRNRVIVPSFDENGNVNYFVARSYTNDSYKYKNPTASKNIIFNELFVDWDDDLVIVEGVFDAIVAGNAVPLLGSTLYSRSPLIKKIVLNDTPVYIAIDPDAPDKERKIIETLLAYDIELYKIDISGYEDVGSMPKNVFVERKNKAQFIDQDNYLLLNLLSAV